MLDDKLLETRDRNDPDLGGAFLQSTHPVLEVDIEKYQSYLDNSDMTDAEKQAFLESLWTIIVNFVELGFGVHPVQEVRGQNDDNGRLSSKPAFDSV